MRSRTTACCTAITFLVMAGCATQRGIDLPELSDWETRARVLASVADWEFSGRIGVSGGDDGFNGKLRYLQKNADFRATVAGPLGFGTVRIEGNDRHVTVTDKDGAKSVLYDPESDLRARYGWTLPVASLRFWALGIPDPGAPAQTAFDEDGQLVALEQRDWRVSITQYGDGGGQPMPKRLSAVSGDNKVRLVIDNWVFR